MAAEEKEDPASEEDRLDIEGERNEAVELEPQQPTIDNNVLAESSVARSIKCKSRRMMWWRFSNGDQLYNKIDEKIVVK